MAVIGEILATLASTFTDVLPIVVFLFVFQALVIRKPLPNLRQILWGLGFAIAGLGLFLVGLEQALFPLGRMMAAQLTSPEQLVGLVGNAMSGDGWAEYFWVYTFALMLAFSTTIAEPALLAVSMKAHDLSGGAIHIWGLRVAVAIGAAIGVSLGCFRIISGLPLHLFIMAGYVIVVVQTTWAPKRIVPLAYDAGGVTTSTVTVPLITALGLGLAESIPGRNPLLDGFGLVAFAALFPIISVLAYAQFSVIADRIRRNRRESMPKEVATLEEEDAL